MTITYTSVSIAASSGVVTALAQAASPTPDSMLGQLLVPVTAAAISGIISYTVLRTTVTRIERDVAEMFAVLRDLTNRLARLEGRLEGHLSREP